MFLFDLPNGQRILHTGDFRAESSWLSELSRDALASRPVDLVFLDTTYLDPKYSFPPQSEAVQFAVDTARTTEEDTLIVVGSYTIGKEKVFVGIAEQLQCRVFVEERKKRVLDCLEDQNLSSKLTLDPAQARIHVLPMGSLTPAYLSDHLRRFPQFTSVVAFKPTGWSYSSGFSFESLKARSSGAVKIFSIPYSEHSSFTELEQFVKLIRPRRIIPTVNVGSSQSRDKMKRILNSWLRYLPK